MAHGSMASGNLFFHIQSKNKKHAPILRQPLFIGDFSLDSDRLFHHDNRNLKLMSIDFSKSKEVNFDLNRSMKKVKRKIIQKTKEEKLDRLLQWILLNKYKFLTDEKDVNQLKCLSTDFVCFRGLLTELLCSPYERREGWIIHATKFRGTIYLLAVDTPEKKERQRNETDNDKKMSSWGFKFEQYMTNEDTTKGVDENEEYCCMLRSRLGAHSLVYGAEVDGADDKLYHTPHSNLKAFVELKTCKELETQRDLNNFYRFRLKKWWVQSHLVGIQKLICGFRDATGVVHSLKLYNVEEMPHMSRAHWNDNVMFNFLNDFLSWLKEVIKIDSNEVVYEIRRLPNDLQISCLQIDQGFTSATNNVIPNNYVRDLFDNK